MVVFIFDLGFFFFFFLLWVVLVEQYMSKSAIFGWIFTKFDLHLVSVHLYRVKVFKNCFKTEIATCKNDQITLKIKGAWMVVLILSQYLRQPLTVVFFQFQVDRLTTLPLVTWLPCL